METAERNGMTQAAVGVAAAWPLPVREGLVGESALRADIDNPHETMSGIDQTGDDIDGFAKDHGVGPPG